MNFDEKIREIDKLVINGHYIQAVVTAGSLLETLLKTLYDQVFPRLRPADQQKVVQRVEAIGRGKPVSGLTLGQLLGVFKETDLFDQAQTVLGRELPHLRTANYNLFVELRNRATHQGATVEEDEARLYASQLRIFLREAGLIAPPQKPSSGPLPALRPWSQIVRLHSDVERGDTARATYAIDLGALVVDDPNVPRIYRRAADFFAATHLTGGLSRLLEEVLQGLAGGRGDRVLQLRSPFGGGKSHALATLYHAAKNPALLKAIPGGAHLPDPGLVRVAVFDGEKFDVQGRPVNGQQVQTMWGLLAAQLNCYDIMAYHDQHRVAPGGDKIAEMLGIEPTLLLLDEVLKYIEDVLAEKVGDSTLGRLTQSFLQSLSVEVARNPSAVLVYSLQVSPHEAFGNEALLRMLDHLAARLDAKREPVSGDEILAVLRRRLLAETPPGSEAGAAAEALATAITRMRMAHAVDEAERRAAEDDRLALRDRMVAAYPFHPALIDIMRERWASLPDFQRTRGALRFLAVCLHVLKRDNQARALLGPGDMPIADADVANALFTEVGQKDQFKAVLQRDFLGPNARITRIDDRLSREHPGLSGVRPALRLATAILAYSFGGLLRAGEEGGEPVAPGVIESELLASVVGPDLDSLTAQAVLKDLREQCLFLHYDGARYVFKTIANINQILEEEAGYVKPDEIDKAIEEKLINRLAGRHSARLWRKSSLEISDQEPLFLLAYLPLDFGLQAEPRQEEQARDLLSRHGERPRRYRNGLGLAVPERDQVEPLRRAMRYLKAVERVKSKRHQLNLTTAQMQQLQERQKTEETALEAGLRALYQSVWLPVLGEGGRLDLEKVAVAGRPLAAQTMHERLIELLTSVSPPRLFTTITPEKIIELLRLGEGDQAALGISAAQMVESFYSILGFPRLENEAVLRRAIARGVKEGVFGFVSRSSLIQPGQQKEGKSPYLVTARQVRLGVDLREDEIDLSTAAIVLPQAIEPEAPVAPTPPDLVPPVSMPPGPTPSGPGPTPSGPTPPQPGAIQTNVRLRMRLTRQQLYASFNAIGNLADKAGTIHVTVEAEKLDGFDPNWLRNAVMEPLDEADVEVEE